MKPREVLIAAAFRVAGRCSAGGWRRCASVGAGPGRGSGAQGGWSRGLVRACGVAALAGGAIGAVYVFRVRQRAEECRRLWQQKKEAIDKDVRNAEGAPLSALVPRGLWLAFIFLPVGLTAVPAFYFDSLRDWWYRYLRLTLELSGAAFQKWGQWAATRPDIFPREMCECLAGLHAGVRAHAWEHTEAVLKEAFRVANLEEVFEEIHRTPLGSGSIAQVYKARFRGEEEFVAIKVRHPRVEDMLLLDFQLLNAFARAVDRIPMIQWLNITSTLSQFGHTLGAQVRLDFEAINLQRFQANFVACPQIKTAFPQPRTDISHMSADILIESYEPGHSVASFCVAALEVAALREAATTSRRVRAPIHRQDSEVESAKRRGVKLVRSLSGKTPALNEIDTLVEHVDAGAGAAVGTSGGGGGGTGGGVLKRRSSGGIRADDKDVKDLLFEGVEPLSAVDATHVVLTGKDTYLQMLLADNFIHADMHPGNILLRTRKGDTPTLVLIDAGMVDVLSAEELENFVGVFKAMGAGDGCKAAEHLLAFASQQPFADAKGFQEYMTQLFREKCRGYGTGVVLGELLQAVLEGLRRYRVRVDAQYATSIVNLLCVESVAASLDPGFNLLDESEMLLKAHSILGREALSVAVTMLAPPLYLWRTLRHWWDTRVVNSK